jgi:hypothetical protein
MHVGTFMKSLLLIGLSSTITWATPGLITDFNYQVTDIADKNLQKEILFNRLERKMLDLEKSICSNRAQLWAYDLYRFYGINTGKIFIFFTSNIWRNDKKGWMYHVAPYIVENGTEYVMEATYSDVTKPLTVEEWAENEMYNRVKGSECLEITAADTDLTEYFYERHTLPETRASGKPGAKCYIRKVPGYYWFPASIALHDLKRDEKGKKVEYDPKRFEVDDVLDACTEAASTKLGRLLGGGRAKCKKHLGL